MTIHYRAGAPTPTGYKKNPEFIETRSRRVQLMLTPSLHDAVKAAAGAAGVSFNEYVNNILQQAADNAKNAPLSENDN